MRRAEDGEEPDGMLEDQEVPSGGSSGDPSMESELTELTTASATALLSVRDALLLPAYSRSSRITML